MDYSAIANRVSTIINSKSALDISYTVKPSGYTKRYDPETDTYKWYLDGSEVDEPTDTTYTGKCIETNISEYFKVRGYVNERDTVFLTIDIPRPNTGDEIIVGGEEYKVIRVSEVKPSTTSVLYKIMARK